MTAASRQRAKRELPASRMDVNVYPGRIEVYENYSQVAEQRLRGQLKRLGVTTRVVFRSPCG